MLLAVVFENDSLTYSELNRRANQLAHYLAKLGVGPDVLVGILVERSLDMVVGLLGILKAGGAYVPLDPAYPRERVAFMLEDSEVPVLLTQRHLLGSIPDSRAKVVVLDSDWREIAKEEAGNPVNEVRREKPCLRDLHIRLDRQAQGSADSASRGGQLPDLDESEARHDGGRSIAGCHYSLL